MIRLLITLECALLAIIALDRMVITPSVPVAAERSAPAFPAENALVGTAHAQPLASAMRPAAAVAPPAASAPEAMAATPEAVAATSARSRADILAPSRERGDAPRRAVVLPPRRPIAYRQPAERPTLPAPRPDHAVRRDGPKLVLAQQ